MAELWRLLIIRDRNMAKVGKALESVLQGYAQATAAPDSMGAGVPALCRGACAYILQQQLDLVIEGSKSSRYPALLQKRLFEKIGDLFWLFR
jgi:hypothetical protein